MVCIRCGSYLPEGEVAIRCLATPAFSECPFLPRPSEQVAHPDHYGGKNNPYEVIKVLEAWLTREEFVGFLKGNVIKYEARALKKAGAVDYAKALWYQDFLVKFLERTK